MLLKELILLKEMPRRNRGELSADDDEKGKIEPFFASQKMMDERGYKTIAKRDNVEVVLKDDLSIAMIGTRFKRFDGQEGILIFGQLIFKDRLKIDAKDSRLMNKVLQVSVVEVVRESKMKNLGSFLYSSLVQEGYTILSDNLQYEGGYQLWKKLARSHLPNEVVYIMDHGRLMLDDKGQPVEYDGTNIPDEKIWSENDNLKNYVLLVYTKK